MNKKMLALGLVFSVLLVCCSCAKGAKIAEADELGKDSIETSNNTESETKSNNDETKNPADNAAADNSEKQVIVVSGSSANSSKEDILKRTELIVLGEIVEQLPGKYTNPDWSLPDITNAWETSYIVKIKEVYKGTPYDEQTIVVKTWDRVGLPPLDENKYIIESDVEEYTLTVGSEAILCLYDGGNLSVTTDKTGYGITAGSKGYFKATENSSIYQSSKFELDLNNIKQEIADANDAKTAGADDSEKNSTGTSNNTDSETEKNGTETSNNTDSETELIEGTFDSEKQAMVYHISN